jgi:hypothetical protein
MAPNNFTTKPILKIIPHQLRVSTDSLACLVLLIASAGVRKQFTSLPTYVQASLEAVGSYASWGFFKQTLLANTKPITTVVNSWSYTAIIEKGIVQPAIDHFYGSSQITPTQIGIYLGANFIKEFIGRVVMGYQYYHTVCDNNSDRNPMVKLGYQENCSLMAKRSLLNALTTTAGVVVGELSTSAMGVNKSDNFISYVIVRYLADSVARNALDKLKEKYMGAETRIS